MPATIEHLREIIGGDADALAALEALTTNADGELTTEAVLAAARPETSPLHKHFEWDDSAAAEEWRKHQARALIRSYKLHIIDAAGERRINYYTNVVVRDEHVYRRTEEVLRVDALREQQRMNIIRDLNRVRTALHTWEGFSPAIPGVDQAISELEAR